MTQPPPWPPVERPGVIRWFNGYAVCMAIVYALCVIAGVVFLTLSEETLRAEGTDVMEVRIQGVALLVVGIPLMLVFAAGPLAPRRNWVWIFHIVLMGIGLTSVCCLPATIPLLIAYIKPEVKTWFEKGA